MKLIIGLGNPGRRYAKTRHNLGARLLDELAKRHQTSFSSQAKLQAETAKLPATQIVLIKPTTYMNESGRAVQASAQYYKVEPADILLVSDDTNLDFGVARLRLGGSDGGHNGLKSVIASIGPDFYRLRLGVGGPEPDHQPLENFVLADFSSAETAELPALIDKGIDLAEAFMTDQGQPHTIR